MTKLTLLNKGEVIRTNPQEGFWGIAVVLSEKEKTPEAYPKCHIAITPLVFQHEVTFDELKLEDLKPLEFEREYKLKGQEEFSKKEICIGVYTRRNKVKLAVIGRIDPVSVYDGPLPFEPWYNLEVKWPVYGDPSDTIGREAYINWARKNLNGL